LTVRLTKDIEADVLTSGLDTASPTLRERRLRDLFERVSDRIGGGYDYIGDVFSDNMKGLVRVSADGIVSDINRILGGELLHKVEWNDATLSRLVDGTLIHGAKSSEWWERQGDGYSMAFQDQIRMGMARGETILELRNRIMPVMPDGTPNIDLRSEPDLGRRDIVRKARRDAEALVRTSALTVCREAQLDVFEENADVIGGVEWLSTLDDRTTPLCRALDGLEWSIPDYEPKGHNTPWPGTSPHWNCRSIVVPVTKTWEELSKEAGGDSEHAKRLDEAMEDVPESVRASMGGPVPGDMTYSQWFDEQPEERQREILGEKGMEAYESGVPLDKLGMAPRGMPAKPGAEPIPEAKRESRDAAEQEALAKYLEERLAFVLEGIKSVAGKTYCGKEYTPDFFAIGKLETIGKHEVEAREWLRSTQEDRIKSYRDMDSKSSGAAFALPNEHGEIEWVKIGLREDILRDHMIGQVSNANEMWDWDGYCKYEPPLPPKMKTDMLLCHEIAHTQLHPTYGGRDRDGHGTRHEKKMLELMKMLYPGFLGKYERY